jgi:Domain of unknown function (DUF4432)
MLWDDVIIDLQAEQFGPAERVLARHAGLTASVFRYGSGVAGLRLANELGHIVVLPFQGQQIWEARFFGRPLTMRSMFEAPVPDVDFLRTYGAFFLHCGATAMGDPGLEDSHPVHGELPNAPYPQAQLVIGRDETGPFMGLTGRYRHSVAFNGDYLAQPTVKLHGQSSRIAAEMRIRNLRHTPMELMYLAHINFLPVDGAVLVDTVPADSAHIRVRSTLPPPLVPSAAYSRLIDRLEKDPAAHKIIDPAAAIDPELVLSLDPLADERGWAHGMQLLPDGATDFVSYRPDQLDHCLRWLCQTPSESALGLLLPATAEAEGYTAEKAKGNIRLLPPQGELHCSLEFGALDASGAREMRERIESVMQQASSAAG